MSLSRRLGSCLLLLAAGAAAGCATNPATGETQLSLVSEEQEIQMGQQAAQEAAQSIGLVDDEALQQYVQRVGAEIASHTERPELPWTFRVVDDPTPNAFALPGGFIFVTRGLMDLMANESQLATVLGHEIAHVTAKHQVTQISRAQLAQVGLGLGSIFVPAVQQLGGVLSSGLNLLFLHYTRDAERQADALGFRYANAVGYDVREMADVFRSLERLSEGQNQSPLPSWLQTHPGEPQRIEAAEARVAALPTPPDTSRLNRAAYLARIDHLVYGENPRAGFFRGGVFYHPELRFHVAFPQGWQVQNTAQAVMAGSPQQDAVIQLSMASGQGANAAAQGFFSQQGLRAGQVQRTTVGGNPAVVGQFQAQTDQGVLEGLAAFIDYGGRTYQILGYGPAGGFSRNAGLVEQTIRSFGAENSPEVLNVQPNRISIVRTDRAMTLAEFNQRHPSVIGIDELALLNQLSGASATIPAGTPMKRVVKG
jgi:predicted Zn-dependent protease